MTIKDHVLSCRFFQIKYGVQTRFWEDTWIDTHPFKEVYPNIFNIAYYPHVTMATIMRTEPLNISFRRDLLDVKLQEWAYLVAKITHIYLGEGRDNFKWNLHKDGIFTI
jgi:hypothetical protein